MQSASPRTVDGALAGAVATVPMTMALDAVRRRLRWRQRYALEPRLISDQVLESIKITGFSERQRAAISALFHVGYGTTVGAALSKLPQRPTNSPLLNGLAIGLGVWAIGYKGWLPLLGILPPPERRPRGRNTGIIAAHLVWGVCNEYLRQANARLNAELPKARPPVDLAKTSGARTIDQRAMTE